MPAELRLVVELQVQLTGERRTGRLEVPERHHGRLEVGRRPVGVGTACVVCCKCNELTVFINP